MQNECFSYNIELNTKPLIVLTGPTAVGKTDLSIKLAKTLNGEIISADSMQVYKTMDIGTAKIMPQEMDGIKHHLIDICEPDDEFNIYKFQKYSKEAINNIYKSNHLPIIAGGTGFYIQSVLYDIQFSENEDDKTIRNELEEYAAKNGNIALHNLLKECDMESANSIHPNNSKRVIRAIEYYRQTGQPISKHNKEQASNLSKYNFLYLVLNLEREKLYERIDKRVNIMIDNGLVNEVKSVYEKYPNRELVSLAGLGYKEIIAYLEGEITLDEAIYIIKRDTRHFAKRQLTWFRREKDVTWIEKDNFSSEDEILEHIINLCKKKKIITTGGIQ